MTTSINGGLCNGNLDKRQLDNDYHSLGSAAKYKIRKVSAVRDFPLGCGPNAPQPNSNPEESFLGPVVGDITGKEVKDNGEEDFVNQMECQTLEATRGEIDEKELDILVENVVSVAMDGVVNDEEVRIDVQPVESAMPNGLADIVVDDVSKEIVETKAYAVTEECNEVEGSSLIERVSEEKKPCLGCDASFDSLKACSPSESSFGGDSNVNEENSPHPKDKFRTRRVSAIRDFPRLCGPHAPSVVKPQNVTSENMILTEVPTFKVKCESIDRPNDERSLFDMENGSLEIPMMANMEGSQLTGTMVTDSEKMERSPHDHDFEKSEQNELVFESRGEFKSLVTGNSVDHHEVTGKEIVLYSHDKSDKRLKDVSSMGSEVAREVVHGIMAEPKCPWRHGKSGSSVSLGGVSERKIKKGNVGWPGKSKAVARKSIPSRDSSGKSSTKSKSSSVGKMVCGNSSAILKEEGLCDAYYVEPLNASPAMPLPGGHGFDVSLPPFGPSSSSVHDARNRVRETLRLFQAICRKLLQGEEAKSESVGGIMSEVEKSRRIDLQAAKIINEKGKEVNTGTNHIGAVPGVEVGDEFQYRVELALVGVHRLYQAGIDYKKKRDGMIVATSIVASGGYEDDVMENSDILVYSGQGGNVIGKKKQPEDQKLERGNLALKNSISERNPVRVIRGSKEMKVLDSSDAKAKKVVTTYVYDGLYTVDKFWTETGKHGKMVFKFELRRIPGQPELAWKEVNLSKKSKKRPGVCVDDISGGLETFPVCAVNTIDMEKPPNFTYTKRMMYPDWFHPVSPAGCNCTGRCSDSKKCSCATKNGGEIPYNHNGAIVEAKPLVYECGPSCKCPPSCYNRVSQRGLKVKLEIFKTDSRGWGVRSLSFIPSGTFICEYAGELLEDKEAEQRTGNDEYLFDIGWNYNEYSTRPNDVDPVDVNEDGGYTIDAAKFGNIGRFINHSCSPNLYAQYVLYDYEDTRMPHVMLFAAENIPALQELTYHYNYLVGQVRDSDGNVKMKSCFCGSAECTGRMY